MLNNKYDNAEEEGNEDSVKKFAKTREKADFEYNRNDDEY